MKKVGILYHPMSEAAQVKARELQEFLVSRGVSVWLCSAWEAEQAKSRLGDTSLIITTGGDGTILRAAQVALSKNIPITGVNLGKLGFMTELSTDEAMEKLPSLLAGEGWIDERAMLQAELATTDKKHPQIFHALNDIVVARGAVARVIYAEVSIDDEHLTTYKVDGVILSTATGSTGYSLAAGGPILHPQSRDFLLVPLTPHLSSDYTLLLPQASVVKVRVATFHQATLSIDGHINLPLSDGDVIAVKQSPNTARFLRIHPEASFYGTLEERLKGKR